MVELSDALGRHDLIDTDALAVATLLNARTGPTALYTMPMGFAIPTMSMSGTTCSSGLGSPSPTFLSSGRRSGRSGAIRFNRPSGRRYGRDDL